MKHNALARIFRFYVDGFRQMTLGRTLWMIILLKLFIMFAVLKLFFFPDLLDREPTEEGKQEHVATELVGRGAGG